MKISKIREVKDPVRANETDAGIDFFVPKEFDTVDLEPQQSVFIPSGIKVNVPKGYALVAFNKSGVALKKNLDVGASVVDCGYQGEIHIHLTNVGNSPVNIAPEEKIIQFVLLKLGEPSIEFVPEDELYSYSSNRGTGGFGSTGIK